MQIEFTKMQALGNDFIIFDSLDKTINPSQINIKAISERKRGIGCDQVLFIFPGETSGAFRIRIFNADGSEAYQCGNGMRCISKYLVEKNKTKQNEFILSTMKSTMKAVYHGAEELAISVAMPKVSFDHSYIKALGAFIPSQVKLGFVEVGNWHIVFWPSEHNLLSIDTCVEIIRKKSVFFEEVNISLVQANKRTELHLEVWERGTGLTSACGSAAMAAVAMGQALGLVDNKAIVHQAGGELIIQKESEKTLWQSGGAEFVFEGKIDL